MKIIEYFTSENKKHWLDEMKKCDWGAGQYLHQLLSENSLKRMVGETALVPMLVDGDKLIAFCTFAPLDDIQPTDMSPWIGFVYTFPDYRGHRYVGMLLDYAESIATVMDGFKKGWHSVGKYISEHAEELVAEGGKTFLRPYK